MCETFASHWGYAKNDFNFKSMVNIINSFVICRRYRTNLLLNVGLKADGTLRTIDKGMLEILGQWVQLNDEALRTPTPTGIEIQDKPYNFLLKDGKNYYLFLADLSVKGSADVTINKELNTTNIFPFTEKIQSVSWLDSGEPVNFTQTEIDVNVQPEPFCYGSDYVIRIAKITVE